MSYWMVFLRLSIDLLFDLQFVLGLDCSTKGTRTREQSSERLWRLMTGKRTAGGYQIKLITVDERDWEWQNTSYEQREEGYQLNGFALQALKTYLRASGVILNYLPVSREQQRATRLASASNTENEYLSLCCFQFRRVSLCLLQVALIVACSQVV